MFEGIPRYGRLPTWCQYSGLGRSISLEMLDAGVLTFVEIEGAGEHGRSQKWIDIHHGLKLLDQAAQAKTSVAIPSEQRARDLARKARLREAKRALKRAEQRRQREEQPAT